ncbi:MAG: hypothetical protein JWN46_2988, partial [Acidimicrobiales bacterium]|nr:hypothetical protein [Acidimicrobiales bacterium]
CRAVGRAATASASSAPRAAGANRATVVVDTGDGVVWAACISFDGVISGRDALDRADGLIPGLNPVFDTYGGLGAAVCQLRGVGRPPPNCLSGGADYWGYWRNGRYSGGGASATKVRDGDTEAWRWGQGERPGAPTDGSVCAPPPPPTTPTTIAPQTTAAPPPSGGLQPSVPGGGGVTGAPGTTAAPGHSTPGTGPVQGGITSTTTATSVPAPGASTTATTAAVGLVTNGTASASGGGSQQAGGRSTTGATRTSSTRPESHSQVASIVGFVLVLAAISGLVVLARRRRAATRSPVS